ncbi:DUF1559 family PulG-like putative transporter [Lignipirellula cremea]|uniref:DUF1559 family PulG-like putative transporter n=1 Tax=Lignipirellula cremea TaxID=2528010 RepID=UPI001E392EE2
MVELLVVIAIIGVLVAMLLPAVQAAREAARRSQCSNNMKQLLVGVQHFHDNHLSLPTYNGIFPPVGGSTLQTAEPRAIYGSWFVHLMPYLEESAIYSQILADVKQYTNTGAFVSAPGGTLITPAVAAGWSPSPRLVSPAVPARYNDYVGSQEWVESTNGNGYTILTLQWVPPRTPDAGTGTPAVYDYTGCTYTPGSPAVYGPPGPPVNGYVGIWRPEIRKLTFDVLRCPSETTGGSRGLVYSDNWGSTNYVANWNAFTDGNTTKGYQAPPSDFSRMSDGLSSTVFIGEAYALCENRGRTALLAWHKGDGGYNNGGVHNFGLTFSLSNHQVDLGNGPVTVSSSKGAPNPIINPQLVFPLQVRPHPTQTGASGCSSLTAQTRHSAMNVAFGDGSVQSISASVATDIWMRLMLPDDGLANPQEY